MQLNVNVRQIPEQDKHVSRVEMTDNMQQRKKEGS
jgi:hypothetical protein